MSKKLNLGCGRKYLEGYVNCDVVKTVKADKYFDLNSLPYPFEANSAEEILMDNVLEHLENIPGIMEELHRILRPGGILNIFVPYAKSDWALQDPTHIHFFTERTMDYFTAGNPCNFYSASRFTVKEAKLMQNNATVRHRLRNLLPFKHVLRYFLYNIFDEIHFQLQKQ